MVYWKLITLLPHAILGAWPHQTGYLYKRHLEKNVSQSTWELVDFNQNLKGDKFPLKY